MGSKLRFVFVVGLGNLASLLQGVSASTVESAVDASLPGVIAIKYRDHTINGGLTTRFELDNYKFQGAAGDSIRMVLRTSSGGLDPQVTLRDSSNTVLKTASCGGNNVFGEPITCGTNIDLNL